MHISTYVFFFVHNENREHSGAVRIQQWGSLPVTSVNLKDHFARREKSVRFKDSKTPFSFVWNLSANRIAWTYRQLQFMWKDSWSVS